MKGQFILGYMIASLLFFTCCNSSEGSPDFPMDKKYWTADDYHTVNGTLFTLNYDKSELPNLDDPQTAAVFNKLVDTANISVVANDDQLGITYRGEFLKSMFQEYKDLVPKYSSLDKQDHYEYPREYVGILKFGLYLQVPYIQVGNEKILKESTNPDDEETKSVISSNKQVLIKNYNLYLDQINYEDRFNEKSLSEYSQGIEEYFPKLITQILPDGDYSETLELVQNLLKKAKNTAVVQELQKIEALITNQVKK
jgi:hypothetical protein